MHRFVILTHDHPSPHFDLMLEAGAALRTWRLAQPPEAGTAVAAEPIGDHRTAYLDYEGPVGGGRGTVARWDAGTFIWLEQREDRVSAALDGSRLKGRLTLQGVGPQWVCLFSPNQG